MKPSKAAQQILQHAMTAPLSPTAQNVLAAVWGLRGPEVVAQAFRALVFGATTEPLTPSLLIRIADEIDPPMTNSNPLSSGAQKVQDAVMAALHRASPPAQR